MLFLLDANTLIDASKDYYSFKRVPEFWPWLLHQAKSDQVKLPKEILEEITVGNDEIAKWVNKHKQCLLLEEEVSNELVNTVTNNGYLRNPTDEDVRKMGKDPFLIAYAYADKQNRVVITTEISKSSKQGAERHIPDVCKALKVKCENPIYFLNELNFQTSWDK